MNSGLKACRGGREELKKDKKIRGGRVVVRIRSGLY
jgi:hypothetical protein